MTELLKQANSSKPKVSVEHEPMITPEGDDIAEAFNSIFNNKAEIIDQER